MPTCQVCFVTSPDTAERCTNPACGALLPKPRTPPKTPETPKPKTPKELARKSDPSTSHTGAASAMATLGAMQQRAIEAVRTHPGMTAMELSQAVGDSDKRRVGRRLNEVEEAGFVKRGATRACSITGRPCATWWPI